MSCLPCWYIYTNCENQQSRGNSASCSRPCSQPSGTCRSRPCSRSTTPCRQSCSPTSSLSRHSSPCTPCIPCTPCVSCVPCRPCTPVPRERKFSDMAGSSFAGSPDNTKRKDKGKQGKGKEGVNGKKKGGGGGKGKEKGKGEGGGKGKEGGGKVKEGGGKGKDGGGKRKEAGGKDKGGGEKGKIEGGKSKEEKGGKDTGGDDGKGKTKDKKDKGDVRQSQDASTQDKGGGGESTGEKDETEKKDDGDKRKVDGTTQKTMENMICTPRIRVCPCPNPYCPSNLKGQQNNLPNKRPAPFQIMQQRQPVTRPKCTCKVTQKLQTAPIKKCSCQQQTIIRKKCSFQVAEQQQCVTRQKCCCRTKKKDKTTVTAPPPEPVGPEPLRRCCKCGKKKRPKNQSDGKKCGKRRSEPSLYCIKKQNFASQSLPPVCFPEIKMPCVPKIPRPECGSKCSHIITMVTKNNEVLSYTINDFGLIK